MKKKILLFSLAFVVLVATTLIAFDSNKSVNLYSANGFVLENAIALADGECGSGKVIGSPWTGTCNQPISDKKKCTTSIITCQGSTSCCERKTCSLHN